MAEALVEVADPLVASLDYGQPGSLTDVAAAMRGAIAPAEAHSDSPGWLRPDQMAPFRRLIAATGQYGAALLADPVGSGKTYVALAAAQRLSHSRPVLAVVPAALVSQWRETASRLEVSLSLFTHEMLSRGKAPAGRAGVVIVDESHRFRNAGTCRYQTLARWLVHRPRLLLLSATPVVNRLDDLAHQLLLGLRSDALALDGVPDLLQQLGEQGSHPALGRVVLCRPAPIDRPEVHQVTRVIAMPTQVESLIARIEALQLSRHQGIAALIRMTLLRALASSIPALTGALRRYQALLAHAAAATESGAHATRAAIRQFTGTSLDQLVMWELLPAGDHPADLVLDDRALIAGLLEELSSIDEPRFAELQRVLSDGEPTVVFTGSRDTLTALRRLPWSPACAWISGDGAGMGSTRVPAATVLRWFRPDSVTVFRRPDVLLATDIAAEGLDLQRVTRLLHFDLPWTPMRIEQREGRAVRLGQASPFVTVVRWQPWPALETRLGQLEGLITKQHRIERLGISDESHWLFRWRSEFTSAPSSAPLIAAARGERAGWLIGIAIDHLSPDGQLTRAPADLVWFPDQGEPIDEPLTTVGLLNEAEGAHDCLLEVEPPRARIAEWIRQRLRDAERDLWVSDRVQESSRQLLRMLRHIARDAASQRDQGLIELTDQVMNALRGGLTAGEHLLVDELSQLPIERLRSRLGTLRFPPRTRSTGVPRLIGAVRFILPP